MRSTGLASDSPPGCLCTARLHFKTLSKVKMKGYDALDIVIYCVFYQNLSTNMCLRVGFDTEKRLLCWGVFFALGVFSFWLGVSIFRLERGFTGGGFMDNCFFVFFALF